MIRSVVAGCGSYLPSRIVRNADLDPCLATNDAWIRERTGIEQRHIAAEGEFTSDLAAKAGMDALRKAGLSAESVDVILLATSTPDYTLPSAATLVQQKMGCTHAAAMDINAACSGFVYAMTLADALIRSGQSRTILVIGAETMSRVVDWSDRGICILFGDGAGAVILTAQEGSRGIVGSEICSDGTLAPLLKTSGGVSMTQTAGFLQMQGKEVFRHAVSKMTESSQRLLAKHGLSVTNVDWVVPHQANARILLACMEKLEMDTSRLIMTVDQHANTSAASIPLALAQASTMGKIKKDDIVLLTALGAGLTWGSCIIQW
ncbi:MAG: ketoacyl-ACP synthase III [Rickettsiales bacterium]|nr:ketoacyl-ACP synthase III [Rickettsiales bacterium]